MNKDKYQLSSIEKTPSAFFDLAWLTRYFRQNVEVRYCSPAESDDYLRMYFPETYSGFLLRDGSQ